MPLTKSMPDPFGTETLDTTYIRCYNLGLNFAGKHITINFGVWQTEDAWVSGKKPISTFIVELTPDGRPAVYTEPPELTPFIPAVTPVYGPNGETLVEAVDAIPATYGESELLLPAFPSFDQVLAQNIDVYNALALVVNTLAKLQDPTLTDYPEE